MKTEFETELREAFAARAACVPVEAASRLRSIDYRPRQHRLRAPAVGAGVLAGAATAGTVLAVALGGTTPAYAGWSATPTSAAEVSPSADATCLSQLASMASGPGRASAGSGSWENVLTDVRGPFTVALFQDDGSYAACFTSSSFTEVNQISNGSGSHSGTSSGIMSVHAQARTAPGPTAAASETSIESTSSGSLQQVVQSHLTTATDGPYTLVDGRTQPGVTGVTLLLGAGQDVVATVADGWFVAWWPGSSGIASAQVTTASGTTTEPLLPLALPTPPPPSGGSGSASSGSASNSGDSGNSGNSGTGLSSVSNP